MLILRVRGVEGDAFLNFRNGTKNLNSMPVNQICQCLSILPPWSTKSILQDSSDSEANWENWDPTKTYHKQYKNHFIQVLVV